ncbi:MAG: hypothetical protein ACUVRS_07890 [Armatimonadota bacterium]
MAGTWRVLATVLLIGSANLAPAANLLINPGFEDPIGTEWTTTILSGSPWFLDRSTAAAHSGSYGYELRYGPTDPEGHAYVEQVVSGLVPGGNCTVTGWLSLVWKRTDRYWGYIEVLGGGPPAIAPVQGGNIWPGWTQYTLNQTADVNGQLTVRLHNYKYYPTVGGDKVCTVYFDDLTVEGPIIPEPSCILAVLAGIASSMGARLISRKG